MASFAICPVLIIKDKNAQRAKHASRHLRFGVCVDGSEKSFQGLLLAEKVMNKGAGD
jgi:hypothetical protein